MRAIAPIRPIQVKYAPRRKMPRRAAKQRFGGLPRRDVDHVDAHDRRDSRVLADAPVVLTHIERKRRVQIREARMLAPRVDGCARGGIRIAWLPHDAGQRRRAMHGMLTGAARDLQHDASGRQHARQDR